MSETTHDLSGAPAEPRRLTRSRDGRWLGGVCAGLGRYFDLSPLVYRIAFAALALAGGTGILLYLAAWLVIPDEGVEDSIAAEAIKQHRERPWLLVGVGLLAFGAILALSEARLWPSPGNLWLAAALGGAAIVWWQLSTHERRAASPATGEAGAAARSRRRSLLPVATGILIAGLGVLALLGTTGALRIDWRIALAAAAVALGALVALGWATGYAVGSVAVLGLAVLAALALALAVRVPVFAGVGSETEHPLTIAAVQTRYEHGVGDFRVDLRDVAFPPGRTHVTTTLGIGNMTVLVPASVTVELDGRASVGDVVLLGRRESGTGVHDHVVARGADAGRVLVLDARVGLGELRVERG